jgi:hypothetical protein
MTKRILADIDEILKRIDEAHPSIPELSRAEVVVLKAKLPEFKPSLSLSQGQNPAYMARYKRARQLYTHLKSVVEANENLAASDPPQSRATTTSENKGGHPIEYDAEHDADLYRRWQEREPGLSKKEFAAHYAMTVADFNRLMGRVRSKKRRARDEK